MLYLGICRKCTLKNGIQSLLLKALVLLEMKSSFLVTCDQRWPKMAIILFRVPETNTMNKSIFSETGLWTNIVWFYFYLFIYFFYYNYRKSKNFREKYTLWSVARSACLSVVASSHAVVFRFASAAKASEYIKTKLCNSAFPKWTPNFS